MANTSRAANRLGLSIFRTPRLSAVRLAGLSRADDRAPEPIAAPLSIVKGFRIVPSLKLVLQVAVISAAVHVALARVPALAAAHA